MEVHAHTHTARKKWTHYFWEFIMLFLVVRRRVNVLFKEKVSPGIKNHFQINPTPWNHQ
ncbi:MAG: hypothetical protein H7Y01_06585 [Ferruginibacter sp.]|nr:hypothetical protein [Chitinophagaceae bacterium]